MPGRGAGRGLEVSVPPLGPADGGGVSDGSGRLGSLGWTGVSVTGGAAAATGGALTSATGGAAGCCDGSAVRPFVAGGSATRPGRAVDGSAARVPGAGPVVVVAAGGAVGFRAALFFVGGGSLASFSFSRRSTGASTVEEADRTNSPMSFSMLRTVLLSTPSSFASS